MAAQGLVNKLKCLVKFDSSDGSTRCPVKNLGQNIN